MELIQVKVGASWCGKCRQIEWTEEDGEYWDFDNLTSEQQDIISSCEDIKELPIFLLLIKVPNSDTIYKYYTDKCETIQQVKEWFIRTRMEYLSNYYDYKKSEHFDKIVNARIRMGLNWNQCPCGGEGRGCISELCHKEIAEQGHCHCNCYLKGD